MVPRCAGHQEEWGLQQGEWGPHHEEWGLHLEEMGLYQGECDLYQGQWGVHQASIKASYASTNSWVTVGHNCTEPQSEPCKHQLPGHSGQLLQQASKQAMQAQTAGSQEPTTAANLKVSYASTDSRVTGAHYCSEPQSELCKHQQLDHSGTLLQRASKRAMQAPTAGT
ncbi:hypothetical protein NDU88_001384 [Pleurodeles waltl]|uniref:Androgen receptor n=1 Tax=Pleurodeles waltl TaxID=8319 RepID=A0AAV7WI65_PLEWA|nr:hypothetical protein NDU88_001384 [Pleurodeles waltl]